jgi:hypothetical protein
MHPLQILANYDRLPRDLFSVKFIDSLLAGTRVFTGNQRNSGPVQLAGVARSLNQLGHRPDFGFTHNYAQAARKSWAGFSPEQVGEGGERGE